jgi:Acyl-CoA synthetases (AMP-forming)/AMP-acid ligases II
MTEAAAPEPGNLGKLFRHIDPAREAVLDLGGQTPRRLTYGQLDGLADAAARGLAELGLERGQRFAIAALNRLEYLALLLGALRAGIVPVLINVKLGRDAIDHILADSGARLLFAEPAFAHFAAGRLPVVDLEAEFEGFLRPGPFQAVEVAPGDESLLPYTSGTTGKPKGVRLHHGGQGWATRALVAHRRLRADDRILISAPFYHKNALVALKTALFPGATILILPRFDAAATIAAIADHGCTMVTGVPTMMSLLLRDPALAAADRTRVRVVSMGSSPASDQLLADLGQAFPNAEIHLNYGSTEGGPIMFGWYHPEGKPRPPHSIGYPIPGCEYRLEGGPDPDQGELWVRNPGIAHGYLNLPEATARRFQDGWYRTSDILRRDADGWFHFLGRVDDMFVCGGENVYPQEVEGLLERHPDVRQAAVLSVPHPTKGAVPVAFVVPQSGRGVDEAALKAFALANGPAYAHPRRIHFVDGIPLTGTNKIDRAALLARAGQDHGDTP